MKNDGVVFIHLLMPQAFAIFIQWHPQLPLSTDAPLTASSPESSEGALLITSTTLSGLSTEKKCTASKPRVMLYLVAKLRP